MREILHLHLFEFPCTENELPGGDFIAKRLTDLRDTERYSDTGRVKHILVIDINPLTRLAAQIDRLYGSISREIAEIGLYQQIEFLNRSKIFFPTLRTNDILSVFIKERIDFGLTHFFIRRHADFLKEVIRAHPGMARFAFCKRIGKSTDVSGCFPNLRMHKNCGVQTDDVFAHLHHIFPPFPFERIGELDTIRTEIIHRRKSSINF